jgi:hypothetical protein
MLNIRYNFNVRSDKIKQAVDAGVSMLFKDVFSLLEQTPIDKNQQALLDEVKKLADSLKNTVLDTSEEKIESKDHGETRQFIAQVIDKEVNRETLKPKRPKGQDKKSDQILPGKPDKPETEQIDPVTGNGLKENPIAAAEYKKPHQPQGIKKQKNITPIIESMENTLEEKSSSQTADTSADTPIAKLKNMVVEKVKILEILQRQIVQSKVSPKDPDEIAPGSISHPQTIAAIAGQKNLAQKGKILFEKQLSKRKAFKLTKKQEENVEKLLIETKANRLNNNGPPKKGTIKLDEMISGQVRQNTRDQGEVNRPLTKKIVPNKETDSLSLKNPYKETKKVFAPGKTLAKTPAKSDQKSEDAVNKYDTGLYPGWDTRLGFDPPQSRDTRDNQNQDQNHGTQERFGNGIPEELQTAVQWMAQEEVENKLVELLSRQAKLRGVDLS